MKIKSAIAIFFLIPVWLSATDLKPWLDPDFQIIGRATALFQFYPYIKTPHRHIRRNEGDGFYTLSGSVAACNYSGEVELTVADTHQQHLDVDNIRLTGRYLAMDDILGDPVSLTVGASVIQAFRHSLFDISSFHHAQIAVEGHIAFGQECSCYELWTSRWWSVFRCGGGDTGALWMSGFCAWEKNWDNEHELRLFAESLYGFGGRNIRSYEHFRGYGGIKHRSLDVGVRYTRLFAYGEALSIQYSFRPYAYNFPACASLLEIKLFYPFGI